MTKEETDVILSDIEKKYKTYTCSIGRGNGKSFKTTLDFLSATEIINIIVNDILNRIKAEIDELPDLNPDYEMDKTIHVSK